MRVMITGEEGFIAKNLPASFEALGHEFVSLLNNKSLTCLDTGEPCVYRNTEDQWAEELSKNEVDLIVHNAAVVGTDVVALNSSESTQSNVTGTYNICRAARKLNIPVCYIGTTVIYDTAAYQRNVIHETSVRYPRTLYGIQKRASEDIVMSVCKDYNIVRPLFAYGGVGDMNSLISKTFYAATKGVEEIDMFLDPSKIKDYMHDTSPQKNYPPILILVRFLPNIPIFIQMICPPLPPKNCGIIRIIIQCIPFFQVMQKRP